MTLIAMALIAAGCAATVPHDWKRVDVQDISFYAPPDLRPDFSGHCIDSFCADFVSPGLRIGFLAETVYRQACGPDSIL